MTTPTTGDDGDDEQTGPSNTDAMARELIAEARRRAAEALAGSSGRKGADANEIQLEDDVVLNKRRRRVFNGDVGGIPRRARIANDGVLGVYAPLHDVDDDDEEEKDDDEEKRGSRQRLNRTYVRRRLERFDRDLRGYDVQASLIDRPSCENPERIGVSSSSSIARRAIGRASEPADADAPAGSARAGLGSRPSDAASIDDPYARYRSERSSAYRRERDFGLTRGGASASTAKRT